MKRCCGGSNGDALSWWGSEGQADLRLYSNGLVASRPPSYQPPLQQLLRKGWLAGWLDTRPCPVCPARWPHHEFTKGDFQPPFCLRVLEPLSRIYPLLPSSYPGAIVVPSLRHFGIFDCSQPELESTSGSFLVTKRGLRFLLHPDFELPPRWQQDPPDT